MPTKTSPEWKLLASDGWRQPLSLSPAIWLALLFSVFGHLACQSSPPSGDTHPLKSATSDAKPEPTPSSNFSPEKLTPSQRDALDVSQGLRDHNPDSISIAQRMLLSPLLANSMNLYYFKSGELPSTVQPLLDTLPVWPLTALGEPWPIHGAAPDGIYPSVWIDGQSSLQSFDLVIESTAFDGVATRPFEHMFTAAWEGESGTHLREQDFGGIDPGVGRSASLLCSAIATYRAQLGDYPAAPADAFETYSLGLISPVVDAIESAYPNRTFYRSPDGKSFGLLLDGSTERPRLFMRHYSSTGTSTMVTDFGYPSAPGIQKAIDGWLSKMELWADWSSLKDVPRIPVPQAPSDPEPHAVTPGRADAPDAASTTH